MTLRPLCLTMFVALSALSSAHAADGDSSSTFRLSETAGLRRFGFPVHARLPEGVLGPVFRLERDGKAVPAQFRRVEGDGRPPFVALDFNASIGPLEEQTYQVFAGPGVAEGPAAKGGMAVELKNGAFRISNGGVLAYEVPESLDGLFRSVENVRLEFWRPGNGGLTVSTKDGKLAKLGEGTRWDGRVSRSGPFVVALHFEGETPAGEDRWLKSVVDMTFPNSKSWAEVEWTVEDERGDVTGLMAGLPLKIEMQPAVIDLGANNTVYGFVRDGERMTLESVAPSGWLVRKGQPANLLEFARSVPGESGPPEGWAHVSDALRCTALAVDEFGLGPKARDTISVDGHGALEVHRRWSEEAPRPGRKSLKFWLHFVNNPVQIGAVTSPQAMRAPLSVEWAPASP